MISYVPQPTFTGQDDTQIPDQPPPAQKVKRKKAKPLNQDLSADIPDLPDGGAVEDSGKVNVPQESEQPKEGEVDQVEDEESSDDEPFKEPDIQDALKNVLIEHEAEEKYELAQYEFKKYYNNRSRLFTLK